MSAEFIKVVSYGIKVYFKNCLMNLLFKQFAYFLKLIDPGTLKQDNLIPEFTIIETIYKFISRVEKPASIFK